MGNLEISSELSVSLARSNRTLFLNIQTPNHGHLIVNATEWVRVVSTRQELQYGEGCGLWTVDCGLWTVDGGWWTVDGGRGTVDGGIWDRPWVPIVDAIYI